MISDVQVENRVSQRCGSSQKLLVAYLMPEFPVREATLPALFALEQAGVNVIELGMPHSDPLADGRTIQDAAQVAIKNGATLKKTLALVREARQSGLKTALVLMGYINPILRYGLVPFLDDAKAAGADGLHSFPTFRPKKPMRSEAKRFATAISSMTFLHLAGFFA
jgi:tryptophan synthase alpha chain